MKSCTLTVTRLQVQANRYELMSRLADDLAHEVKNPMHAAMINLELLRRRIGDGDAARAMERVRLLEEEIRVVNALVESLLDLVRPEPDRVGPVGVDQVIDEIRPLLEAIGKAARVTVRCEPPGFGDRTVISRAALKHAVLNLVVLALDAVGKEGGWIELLGSRTDGEVQIRIRDSASGVRTGLAAATGEPGSSTRADRGGLGLAVARALIEEAGGRVELEAADPAGRGTTFLLALSRAGGA